MAKVKRTLSSAFLISVVFLVISVLSIIYSFYLARQVQFRMAERYLDMYVERVQMENRVEVNNLIMTLNFAKNWVKNGMMSGDDMAVLNNRALALIENTPQVAALSVLSGSGRAYSVRFINQVWESYYAENDSLELKQLNVFNQISNSQYIGDSAVMYSVHKNTPLDLLRNIPNDSIIRNPLHLTPGTSRMPGVSYSLRTIDTVNNENYFITVYMSLDRINQFLTSIRISDVSEVYLFTMDGRYYNHETHSKEGAEEIDRYLVPWEEAENTTFYEAITAWSEKYQSDSAMSVRFRFNGSTYYAIVESWRASENNLWTAIYMPVSKLTSVFKGKLRLLFLASLILFLASVSVTLILLRSIQKQRKRLNELDDDELLKLISNGESDTIEFKSTVRMNLHANKPGKEIELAWLKTVAAFCNTDGGRLFIGVDDTGNLIGLDADRFPNDDKASLHIQNLIKQHIGLEHTKNIYFSIRDINGKKILVIRCQPSQKPVFLNNNDKEQFFVRSGPASIELPVSKALDYINERKNE